MHEDDLCIILCDDQHTKGNTEPLPKVLVVLELTILSPGEYHVANFDSTLFFSCLCLQDVLWIYILRCFLVFLWMAIA